MQEILRGAGVPPQTAMIVVICAIRADLIVLRRGIGLHIKRASSHCSV